MKSNIPTFILIISAVIPVIVLRSSVFGQRCKSEHSYHWVAGTGDWSVPENWEHNAWDPASERCMRTPGVPQANDGASINNGGTAIITGSVQVGGLNLAPLSYGQGTLIQIGGNVKMAGLGLNHQGKYEINQGSLNANIISYDFWDGGTFIQTDGNVTHNEYLFLKGQGRYELRQGIFNANVACVGIGTPGTFIQTGGNAILGRLSIDEQGTYELHQGSVIADQVFVRSKGTFVQTGGNLTIGNDPFHLCLDEGTYELLGGTIDTPSIHVGYSSGPASFVVNGGVINGTAESDYYAIRVYGSRGSLTGSGTFNIPVVYESDEIYGTSGNRSVDVTFGRNCLTEGGAYDVKQLTPDDFADGNVPNLLESSVFEVNFDGSFCGEFEIAIPYDWTELEALHMNETNLFILYETGPGKYERLDDTIARNRQGVAKVKARTFGKFAIACFPRVILVHGWRPALESGRVATWKTLTDKLDEKGVPYHEFDYNKIDHATGDPRVYAQSLKEEVETLIKNIHERTGCYGKFDIVCHSMGAMVSRWYMEEMGGNWNIRQWIGIAPVNQGAAIADDILVRTLRFLIPGILSRFFPGMKIDDPALEHMRTNSNTVRELNNDGIAPNVSYKVIVGYNGTRRESFCALSGRTFARNAAQSHYLTYQGDGAVAIEQSKLPGSFGIDCVNDVNHTSILASPYVLARVLAYLYNPNTPSLNNTPPPDPKDNLVLATDNRGILPRGIQQPVIFNVDPSVQKVTVIADWQGSDIGLQIITPSKQVLNPNEYPVVEYLKENGVIYYVVDAPTAGAWTANLVPIDVPQEGEPYSLCVFYTSPLTLEVTTTENRTYYNKGDLVNIAAKCTDSNNVITGSVLTATIVSPSLVIENFVLYDDGGHGDGDENDGYYSNDYLILEEGAYQITIIAHGILDGVPFERTMPMTLWVTSKVDLTYDTKVDLYDFATFAKQWMENKCDYPNWCDGVDIDKSGEVDFFDLRLLTEHWLENAAP